MARWLEFRLWRTGCVAIRLRREPSTSGGEAVQNRNRKPAELDQENIDDVLRFQHHRSK